VNVWGECRQGKKGLRGDGVKSGGRARSLTKPIVRKDAHQRKYWRGGAAASGSERGIREGFFGGDLSRDETSLTGGNSAGRIGDEAVEPSGPVGRRRGRPGKGRTDPSDGGPGAVANKLYSRSSELRMGDGHAPAGNAVLRRENGLTRLHTSAAKEKGPPTCRGGAVIEGMGQGGKIVPGRTKKAIDPLSLGGKPESGLRTVLHSLKGPAERAGQEVKLRCAVA